MPAVCVAMTQPGHDWWNEPGVGRVLGKVVEAEYQLTAWVADTRCGCGTARRPALRWFFCGANIVVADESPNAGAMTRTIADDAPLLNPKFLRSFTMGDGIQLAEESARLAEELGLNVPAADLPDPDDLADRLMRIRPDWDWKETLAPGGCAEEAARCARPRKPASTTGP